MRLVLLFLAVAVLAAGCEGEEDDSPTVVAAFYPLAWAAELQIEDGEFEVLNLTPPGVEPHDIELSPRDVETIRDADLVIYVGGGFQPAVEEAVEERDGQSLNVLRPDEIDPHVWLDPAQFAAIVREIGDALGAPGDGRGISHAVGGFLHRDYESGLARCARRTLVTTHAAFGHLADRYGLEQLSLAGRSPESEPSPRKLERLIDEVRASGATTVFSEPLVSDRVAETVARETGAQVAVLDPLEGLSEERLAAGEDYLSVMRDNLEALRSALGCR